MNRRCNLWGSRLPGRFLGVMTCFLLGACSRFDASWVPGSAASLAKDQIMLVRKAPPSFGFVRLMSHSQIYPDLAFFVRQHGIPDFLAETGDQSRNYLILYYLGDRKAFACRTRPQPPGAVEFAGPYPVTPGEYRLLDGFRKAASHAPAS